MKIAIDIDGTITRYPPLFRSMLDAYPYAVILTGYAGHDWEERKQNELVSGRRNQLRPIIGDVTNAIVVCVGMTVLDVAIEKGIFCRDFNIDAIIDDSREYCAAVRRLSPSTAVLRVIE